MTFILALANADQIIQVSDRQLSSSGKATDSTTKVTHCLCDDASFLAGFTGIAKCGRHETAKWLLITLEQAAKNSARYRDITQKLSDEATDYFKKSKILQRLPASDRRLTIMLTGYSADDMIFNALVSNFQDFAANKDYPEDQGRFHYFGLCKPLSENPTIIQRVGQYTAYTESDEKELRALLERRASAKAISQKAISVVQNISDRKESSGTVGKKLNIARIDRKDPSAAFASYATDEIEDTFHMNNSITLRANTPSLMIRDVQMKLASGDPVSFPRVRGREPCPCGSGKRYRECHGQKK